MVELGGVYTRRWSDQTHYPLATALLTANDGFCADPIFGGQCRSTGARGVVCDTDDASEVFIHEHQVHRRPEVVEKCMLEDVDIL